jgi:hypothetical protein
VLVAIASGVTETSAWNDSAEAALSDALTMLAGCCPEHELRLGLDHAASLITETQLVPQLVARLRNAPWPSVLRSATCMPPAARRDTSAAATRRAEPVQNALWTLNTVFANVHAAAAADAPRGSPAKLREALQTLLQQASNFFRVVVQAK